MRLNSADTLGHVAMAWVSHPPQPVSLVVAPPYCEPSFHIVPRTAHQVGPQGVGPVFHCATLAQAFRLAVLGDDMRKFVRSKNSQFIGILGKVDQPAA